MSQITLFADILFNDAASAATLERLLCGQLTSDSAEAGPPLTKLADLVEHQDCHLDEIDCTDRFVRVSLEGGTLTFPYEELIAAIEALDADTVIIEVVNDQVGEEMRKARHRGKRIALGKARKIIDTANPMLGVCNAIEDNSEKRVLKLIKDGLDPNARLGGRSLLSMVCDAGFSRAALTLIAAGADCTAADTGTGRYSDEVAGRTPLHWACRQDESAKTVKALIAAGADVAASDDQQAQPLHYAVEVGQTPVINLLLDAGADIEAKAGDGATPLLIALSCMLDEAAKLLIERGANVHARCAAGGNALWYAGLCEPCVARLEPYELKFSRPSDAYSGSPVGNILRAIERGDREVLPELVIAADTESLTAILKDVERKAFDTDTVEFLIGLAFDDVVDEFAAALFSALCRCRNRTEYDDVRALVDKLRARWPEQLAVIDAQCNDAMTFLNDFIDFVETSGLRSIVSPLSPESQAVIDRLFDTFVPESSYHEFAQRQMHLEKIGLSLTIGLNRILTGNQYQNLPVWRSDGVVSIGRLATGDRFGFGASKRMMLIEGAWKFS